MCVYIYVYIYQSIHFSEQSEWVSFFISLMTRFKHVEDPEVANHYCGAVPVVSCSLALCSSMYYEHVLLPFMYALNVTFFNLFNSFCRAGFTTKLILAFLAFLEILRDTLCAEHRRMKFRYFTKNASDSESRRALVPQI